ncbi:MAG: tetratricopeptide repeat protein [Phycisphaerales bacterium]|nr:MAG: tetratricopeptide repeat protein [Phycisphaerales bacterium]
MAKQRRGRSKTRAIGSSPKQRRPAPTKTVLIAMAVLLGVVITAVVALRGGGSTDTDPTSPPAAGETPAPPAATTPPAYHFKVDPNDPALSAGQMDRALRQEQIEIAQRLVKDLPTSANALFLLAMAYQEQGNSDEAARYLQQCLAHQPQRADAYDQLGRIAQQEGKHDKAVDYFTKARQCNPKMPGINYRLGNAYKALAKPDEAIAALTENATLSPDAPESFLALGELHLQKQEYEAAREHYEAALARDPSLSKAYYGLATAAARLGQREQASAYRRQFKEVEEKERELARERRATYDPLALTRASVAHTHTDVGRVLQVNKQMTLAEHLWRRAAQLDPNNIACRFSLADYYLRANRFAEALPWYEQIIRIQPDNGVAYFFIGHIHEKRGQKAAAQQAYEKVIEVSPDRPEGFLALARFLWENQGDLQRVRQLLQRAVHLAPIAANYAFLARVCHRTGDREAALAAARKALQLAPRNPEYRRLVQQVREN